MKPTVCLRPVLALLLLSCALQLAFAARAALPAPPPPTLEARAWLLIDMQSGLALAERAPDQRIEPASLTKLMTAYLAFTAIKDGQLNFSQSLPVSEHAWKQEGSRMFLEPRKPAKIDDLLKGMIVQSGNDACIVLAEAIAGSETSFAAMMNAMAKKLGMTQTHFMNATGLPHPEHYTTARDLGILARHLISDFPDHYKTYYSLKEFTYAGIRQPNRNRLLWTDAYVDGVKTGHTESAGYCLIASARRDNRRLLSVVLGTGSDAARASESQKLLNYGFQFTETVKLYDAGQAVSQLRVYKGSDSMLDIGFVDDFYVTVPRGTGKRLQAKVITRQPMLAPIDRGQAVGTLRLLADGETVGEYPLQALDKVSVAGLLGRAWDSLMLLFE